jgi:hypothetical protein
MISHPLLTRHSHGIVHAMTLARNRLLACIRRAALEPDERFPSAFGRLVAAVECTFRNEETLMESAGHSGLADRRQNNALLLGALHHAASQVEAGNLAIGREVIAAMPGLLSLHRLSALRMLAYGAPRGHIRAGMLRTGHPHLPAGSRLVREGSR